MRSIWLAALALSFGCITGGRTVRSERDDRMLRVLAQQDRWAQQALDSRPGPQQLDKIRQSDFASVAAGRKSLQKLLQAIDRGTWIRDTTLEMLRDDPADTTLLQGFDRAGRLRSDALSASDELSGALAEAKGGLTAADLRPGFEALRKWQASEDRISREPPRPGLRLAAGPLPTPRPFMDAASKLAAADPDAARQLERFLPPEDVTKMRARSADLDRQQEEQKRAGESTPPAAPPGSTPPPPQDMEAPAPSNTLNISADAARLIAKKPPKSITLREDGLFELSYDDGEYLVDPDGKLVRKDPPEKK